MKHIWNRCAVCLTKKIFSTGENSELCRQFGEITFYNKKVENSLFFGLFMLLLNMFLTLLGQTHDLSVGQSHPDT